MRTRLLLMLAVALGCSGTATESPPPPDEGQPVCILLGPAVSPAASTLRIGDSLRLAVADLGCGRPKTDWRWSSSDTLKATVDQSGLVAARANGTVTIRATATADPTISGAAVVVVGGSGILPDLTIVSINSVSGNTSVPANLSAARDALDATLSVSSLSAFRSAALIVNNGVKDTVVATLAAPAGLWQTWKPVLRWETTARSAAGTAVYPNGNYVLRAQVTDSSSVVTSASQAIKLANP